MAWKERSYVLRGNGWVNAHREYGKKRTLIEQIAAEKVRIRLKEYLGQNSADKCVAKGTGIFDPFQPFVLVGQANKQGGKSYNHEALKAMTNENGGQVRDDVPKKVVCPRKYIVLCDKVGKKPCANLRRASRNLTQYPVVTFNYVFECIAASKLS